MFVASATMKVLKPSTTKSSLITEPLAVIVAEHYPSARTSLVTLLSYDGYRVFEADRVEAAITHINTLENPIVLLADLDMPGWKSIVQHAANKTGALIIGMEGHDPVSKTHDLKNHHGVHVCFQKPLNYNDILTAIKKGR